MYSVWLLIGLASLLACSPEIRAETGICSWYGSEAHGHFTASGEIFNKNALTAAHKTLPFGTRITVTNLENGKKVTVRITDRGPFTQGRIVDLAEAAFQRLAPLDKGLFRCTYTRA